MGLGIRNKLYKLAMWYIGKCNAKWNKPNENIQSLDRLTYRNNEKAYLRYGADAEWQHFSRYDVLDNAIQKLAKYEDTEANISKEKLNNQQNEIYKSMKSKAKIYVAFTDNEELIILNSVSEKGCFDETTLDNRHDCMNEFIWDIKDTDKPVETGVYLLTVEFEFSATEHFDYIVTDCKCLLSTVC